MEAVRREWLVVNDRKLSQANLQQLFFLSGPKGFADGCETRNKEKKMAYNKVEVDFNGQPLTIETGKVARQADGAVIVTYGETKVLCTVVSARKMREGQDFFPLTVNYAEKFYSAGKIPGSFFRRERGSTERETLISLSTWFFRPKAAIRSLTRRVLSGCSNKRLKTS